jgi:predicted transcriptional regulator
MRFLELEIQRKIYNIISKNPGITLTEIAQKVNQKISIILNHLQLMQKDGLITSIKDEKLNRYFLDSLKPGMRDFRSFKLRRKIYDVISQNPGLHLSKISQILNIRISLAEYHLRSMQKDGLLIISKEKGYKRYYIFEDDIGVLDKRLISLLRQEIPLKIILFLLKNPNSRHKDIANFLDISTSALSYHLNKLVKSGIVISPISGENEGYLIKDVKKVKNILREYQIDTIVDNFAETWEGIK